MNESDLQGLSREELLALVRELFTVIQEQRVRIEHLEAEVARLRGGTPPSHTPCEPPSFIKPNRKLRDKGQPKPHKKRPHGFARQRSEPTQVVEHTPECCSQCGRKLSGGWVYSSREVLEIPTAPLEVVEHRFLARRCGICGHRELARPELSSVVLGQSRLGVRLMSLITYLDAVCRLPVAGVQQVLEGLYGLHLSQGAIVRAQHAVAQAGRASYDGLLEEVRQSAVVHADETGAREDGQNGYVWSLSTPQVRYYHRDKSRGARVIQELLGHDPEVYQARTRDAVMQAKKAAQQKAAQQKAAQQKAAQQKAAQQKAAQQKAAAQDQRVFRGKLVSDFYNSYSWYSRVNGAELQRCLVHLDRDLDELKAKHADEEPVCIWVEKVLGLIQRAKEYAKAQREHSEHTRHERCLRRRWRRAFEQEARELAQPYRKSGLPQEVLAERLKKHERELFVFVEHLDVPSDNNAAERAIRPFVVQRKISGGTRSGKGSQTQAVLLSLFGTWLLRGEDALLACQQMLTASASPAPC